MIAGLSIALAVAVVLLLVACALLQKEREAHTETRDRLDEQTVCTDLAERQLRFEQARLRKASEREAAYLRLAAQRAGVIRIMEGAWPQTHQVLPTLVKRPDVAAKS